MAAGGHAGMAAGKVELLLSGTDGVLLGGLVEPGPLLIFIFIVQFHSEVSLPLFPTVFPLYC